VNDSAGACTPNTHLIWCARPLPARQIERFSRVSICLRDGTKVERLARLALLRLFAGLVEICFAILFPYNLGVAVGIDEDGNLFIDTDGADGFCLAGCENTGHEDQQAAFAVARVEVGVGDDAVQDRNAEQIGSDDDLTGEGIGEGCVGAQIGTVGRIVLGGSRCTGRGQRVRRWFLRWGFLASQHRAKPFRRGFRPRN